MSGCEGWLKANMPRASSKVITYKSRLIACCGFHVVCLGGIQHRVSCVDKAPICEVNISQRNGRNISNQLLKALPFTHSGKGACPLSHLGGSKHLGEQLYKGQNKCVLAGDERHRRGIGGVPVTPFLTFHFPDYFSFSSTPHAGWMMLAGPY